MKMWRARPGRDQKPMERFARAEWKRRLENQQTLTPLQARIGDMSISLEIDTFFQKQKYSRLLRPVFIGNEALKPLLRRCVEVATNEALSGNQERVYEDAIPDWERGMQLADRAGAALDQLLNWLSEPNPAAWKSGDREKAARAIIHCVRHAIPANGIAVEDRAKAATEAAHTLLEVRAFLASMPEAFSGYRNSLISQNPGEVEQKRFVETLAEGWFCLSATIPTPAGSDFKNFVTTVWRDIGGEDAGAEVSFSHAIREASKALSSRNLPPHWKAGWFW
jgi:hypothetical protein